MLKRLREAETNQGRKRVSENVMDRHNQRLGTSDPGPVHDVRVHTPHASTILKAKVMRKVSVNQVEVELNAPLELIYDDGLTRSATRFVFHRDSSVRYMDPTTGEVSGWSEAIRPHWYKRTVFPKDMQIGRLRIRGERS